MKPLTKIAAALSLAAAALMPARALAVDLSVVVLDENNNPGEDTGARPKLPNGAPDPAAPPASLTVGRVLFLGLLTYPDEPDDKFRRGDLAFQILSSKEMTFSPEQTILLKKVVNRVWPAIVVFRVFPLLDPTLAPKK